MRTGRHAALSACVLALADEEPALERLFDHCFQRGPREGLRFGDDFMEALVDSRGGLDAALAGCGSVLAMRGDVLLAGEVSAGEIILRLLDADLIVEAPGWRRPGAAPGQVQRQIERAIHLSGAIKVPAAESAPAARPAAAEVMQAYLRLSAGWARQTAS